MLININDNMILIDDEDYDLICQYSWHINHCSNTSYAFAHIKGSKPFGVFNDPVDAYNEYKKMYNKLIEKETIAC